MNAVTKALLFVAAALVLAGFVVGFAVPLGAGCGTAFIPGESTTFDGPDFGCETIRGQARGLPAMLLTFGAVAVAAALAYANPSQAKDY